jgi:hypothetical protein
MVFSFPAGTTRRSPVTRCGQTLPPLLLTIVIGQEVHQWKNRGKGAPGAPGHALYLRACP